MPFFDSLIPLFFGGRLNKTQNKRTSASRAVRATKAKNQPEERENVFNEKACSAWCRPCMVAKEKRKPGGPTFQSLI
tara:strand:+ start:113 stop:343 length:231 start_codon:yes stop_codon:yes gene_type:complete